MIASLTLLWSSLSLLIEVLVYDLCLLNLFVVDSDPLLPHIFVLLKRFCFCSAVSLTCLYLLWASLWSSLLCSSVWHSILLCCDEVTIAFSVATIINFAELAYFERDLTCAHPYAHALLCFTKIITHKHIYIHIKSLPAPRVLGAWSGSPPIMGIMTVLSITMHGYRLLRSSTIQMLYLVEI